MKTCLASSPRTITSVRGRNSTKPSAAPGLVSYRFGQAFARPRQRCQSTDLGTTLTRERWLLQLFQELGYGRLIVASPVEIDGKTYPISHVWPGQYYQVPIHLVSFRADLDKRSEQRIQGASKASPHGMVQEYLNRSEHHLWALASNGLKLLILRDNASLTRQAYVEFDLEGIFDGEAYSDFRLLWMLCHQSRLEGTAQDRPETCWLEVWSKQAETEGRRALDQLRVGVQKALENFGTGFIAHKANQNLRDRLQAGDLQKQDLYRQLLRLVYRLIFLFVAEDRGLLHSPSASDEARSRYARFYSGQRLRRMAERTRGSRHADLWVGLRLVFARLGDDRGCPELGLPALGGFLFGPEATPDLEAAELSNEHLLQAIRNLGLVKDRSGWRLVDYRNLGSEELGSVYESLLELNPTMELGAGVFTLGTVAGNQRKTSGSYYTPDSLVQSLLDSALDPVVEEAVRGKSPAEAERAILALKVCDPAVGSGHFLVGAAHRLADHLARARASARGESEPSPLFHQQALRDVIGRCLYGVDMNPMAAELCRVSLWLEAIEPGKPLSFLDHHIRVGNSLLGTTPALLAKGIPDEAFIPIEGDDREICSKFKRVNRDERNQQIRLFAATTEPWEKLGSLAAVMMSLDAAPDDSIDAIRKKEQAYDVMVRSGSYLDGQFSADSWCAAFVWKKTLEFNYPITDDVYRRIERDPRDCDGWMRIEIERLAKQYQFFHWHIAFADVFTRGGFDCVLGNPPWERMQVEAPKYFAAERPELLALKRDEREEAIAEIAITDPPLHQRWLNERRKQLGTTFLLKKSGFLHLSVGGNVNSYGAFLELGTLITAPIGICGMIVQSGIATDDQMKSLFGWMVESGRLHSLFDFENRHLFFRDVHPQFKFCLITVGGAKALCDAAAFAFFAESIEDTRSRDKRFFLTSADIQLLNPNTLNCPTFRSAREAELAKSVYARLAVLSRDDGVDSGWDCHIQRMYDMAYDASHFRTVQDEASFPGHRDFIYDSKDRAGLVRLFEAKYMHQFDHRFATTVGLAAHNQVPDAVKTLSSDDKLDPGFFSFPRYWVEALDCGDRFHTHDWQRDWIVAGRQIARASDERTSMFAILPFAGVSNSCYTFRFSKRTPEEIAAFVSNVNSLMFDWCARQKVGGANFSVFIVRQLPVATPKQIEGLGFSRISWFSERVLELTYTAWDIEVFARDSGYTCPPFRWDEDRRFLIRCELDAAFFHLYLPSEADRQWKPLGDVNGAPREENSKRLADLMAHFSTPRDAVDYILDAFPIMKRKDEEKWGEYRTKRVILEVYDAISEAIRAGIPYESQLRPPPADPRCCHPRRKIGALAFGSLITEPGPELQSKISMRIKVKTPFPVEYGRISRTRGDAPTLVPHESGAPVSAEILVLDDDVSIAEATDMLWRRERRHEGTGENYSRGTGENSVLVEEFHEDPCVSTVLYTDFNMSGKIPHPTAADLAKRAIASVAAAKEGMDGITYLMNAIHSGIETPLTADYKAEILKQTLTLTLEEALKTVRERL